MRDLRDERQLCSVCVWIPRSAGSPHSTPGVRTCFQSTLSKQSTNDDRANVLHKLAIRVLLRRANLISRRPSRSAQTATYESKVSLRAREDEEQCRRLVDIEYRHNARRLGPLDEVHERALFQSPKDHLPRLHQLASALHSPRSLARNSPARKPPTPRPPSLHTSPPPPPTRHPPRSPVQTSSPVPPSTPSNPARPHSPPPSTLSTSPPRPRNRLRPFEPDPRELRLLERGWFEVRRLRRGRRGRRRGRSLGRRFGLLRSRDGVGRNRVGLRFDGGQERTRRRRREGQTFACDEVGKVVQDLSVGRGTAEASGRAARERGRERTSFRSVGDGCQSRRWTRRGLWLGFRRRSRIRRSGERCWTRRRRRELRRSQGYMAGCRQG